MAKDFPLNPKHPERICRGCDRHCPTQAPACGNGSGRDMHPGRNAGGEVVRGVGHRAVPRPSTHGAGVGQSIARDRPRVMRRHDRRGLPA
ncbi:DUF3079 domain-containing protein [Lysobacter changpingensis]|uniref:DUF3079 domain-containing protein n=1 Tax=Lysobacter changpingensis TaxID=2792784 RepID=UPI001F5C70F3